MNKKGIITDPSISTNKTKRHVWTEEEIIKLEDLYKEGYSFEDISKIMKIDINVINHKSSRLRLGDSYMRNNNPNFKAIYQDYNWCFERFVNKGMTHKEMADECGASLRVIQKWCCERHHINKDTFKELKRLNQKQYEIIMFGRLGDGHIDRRENEPMYIESHAEGEKDYIFWKYSILKDLCNKEPRRYEAKYVDFGTGKQYLCQPFYRLNTRTINHIKEIRNMTRLEIIEKLNEFGLALHILDDGYRDNLWELCLVEYTDEEVKLYLKICEERFGLNSHREKDERYIRFDAFSSRKIDSIILRNIPNDLDIIHKKILDNEKIPNAESYIWITDGEKRVGLNNFCRTNGIVYMKAKQLVNELGIKQIERNDFLELLERCS